MRTSFILILALVILTACSPSSNEKTGELKDNDLVEKKVDEKDVEGNVNDGQLSYDRSDLERKLDFDKDILLLEIKEINNEALYERPFGGIASQDSYIMNGDTLYLFYNAELPTEKTDMVITEETLNYDYLLNYKLHQLNGESAKLNIEEIGNEYVNNGGRLFLNNMINIEHIGSGKIIVSINNETIEIESGDEGEIIRSNNDIESKIVVMNYGLINSIDNIIYEELSEEDKARLPDEYKRSEINENDEDNEGSN